jgi:hypothetical protein
MPDHLVPELLERKGHVVEAPRMYPIPIDQLGATGPTCSDLVFTRKLLCRLETVQVGVAIAARA